MKIYVKGLQKPLTRSIVSYCKSLLRRSARSPHITGRCSHPYRTQVGERGPNTRLHSRASDIIDAVRPPIIVMPWTGKTLPLHERYGLPPGNKIEGIVKKLTVLLMAACVLLSTPLLHARFPDQGPLYAIQVASVPLDSREKGLAI